MELLYEVAARQSEDFLAECARIPVTFGERLGASFEVIVV
jgi:hypothetical protein